MQRDRRAFPRERHTGRRRNARGAAVIIDVKPGYSGFVVEVDGFRTAEQSPRFRLTLETVPLSADRTA
jgi:hypothetical protein